MTGPVHKIVFSMFSAAVLIYMNSALAEPYEDPDWPCIQRLMPEISAVTIWDGPPVDDALRIWSEKPAVRDLVARLAARQANSEQTERNIADFVMTLKNEEKNSALTMLFAGLWVTFNDRRRTMIEGIKNFARQQSNRTKLIENKLLDLDRVLANATANDHDRIETLRHDIYLEVRIFESREKTILFLCDKPVRIESTLGGLARAISAQLD